VEQKLDPEEILPGWLKGVGVERSRGGKER